MRYFGFTILFALLLSNSAYAWICEEASLQHLNDRTVLACGVATSKDLSVARKNAFLDAKNEFDLYCNNSFKCKGNAVDLVVKRTDCIIEKSQYTCYRALEFTVLNKPAPEQDYSALLEQKEKELSNLYAKVEQIRKLNDKIQQIDNTTESLKLYEETKEEALISEIGSIRQKDHWESHFRWAAKIGLSYSAKTIKNPSENYELWGWRFDVERNFNRYIAFGIGAELFSKSPEERNVSSSPTKPSKKQPLFESDAIFINLPITLLSSSTYRFGIRPVAIWRTTYFNQTGEKAIQNGYGADIYYDHWFNRDSYLYGFSTQIGYKRYENDGPYTGAGALTVSLAIMFGI